MIFKILTTILGFQAALSIAAAGDLSSKGTLKVVRSFDVVRTHDLGDPKAVDKSELRLTPGTYNFEVSNWTATEHTPCLPPFCGNSSYEVPVVNFTLLESKSSLGHGILLRVGSVDFEASSKYVKEGLVAYAAASSRQSFNIYSKVSEQTRKVKSRTEEQECEVKATCHEGGYGGGYGFGYGRGYYGGGCDYAVGRQTVLVHDEITTKMVRLQITGASNELLATFNGSEEGEPDRVVDKEGVCRLNVPR